METYLGRTMTHCPSTGEPLDKPSWSELGAMNEELQLFRAHADKLAKALSHLLARPEDASEYQAAEAALADYEASKEVA